MNKFSFQSNGVQETGRVATTLAPFLRKGDILILTGALAAGKTYFVKALAKAMGSADLVTSPTYTIANFYDITNGQLIHLDVYRLLNIAEFRQLGLEEYFYDATVVIEWGDLIAEEFTDYLSLEFEFTKISLTHRSLTFSYIGDRWKGDMDTLRKNIIGQQE
jgi:tRNA threonylcarbamoyladenosine biosynthesis protein TsaE